MDIKIGSQWKFNQEHIIKYPHYANAIATVENVVNNKVFYRWVGISVDSDGILMNAGMGVFLKELEPYYLDSRIGTLNSKIKKIKAALKV